MAFPLLGALGGPIDSVAKSASAAPSGVSSGDLHLGNQFIFGPEPTQNVGQKLMNIVGPFTNGGNGDYPLQSFRDNFGGSPVPRPESNNNTILILGAAGILAAAFILR